MSRSRRAHDAPPPPKEAPDDAELREFAQAVADVAPIPQDRLPPEPVWRDPTTLSQREQEVLRVLEALVEGRHPLPIEDTDEHIQGKVPGLDPRVMRQLARGEIAIQAELDLHGCDAASGRMRLERFIVDAHARGLRCVKIVHGRGLRSPGGVPVLKAQLPRWLARGPARLIVLAYTSARANDGGTGASYVLLRRGPYRS
jgi:DNA-nicking Smr family endonuclease